MTLPTMLLQFDYNINFETKCFDYKLFIIEIFQGQKRHEPLFARIIIQVIENFMSATWF